MRESLQRILPDEDATLALGAELAAVAAEIARSRGVTLFLHGDLGVGKTTLTRGLLRSLGVTGAVKSPTYTLVEPYVVGELNIYHFDLYRLRDSEELEFMGVRDYFQPGSLCIVEWPERGGDFISSPDFSISIQSLGDGRRVQMESFGEVGELLLKRLDAKNIRNISDL